MPLGAEKSESIKSLIAHIYQRDTGCAGNTDEILSQLYHSLSDSYKETLLDIMGSMPTHPSVDIEGGSIIAWANKLLAEGN